MERKRAGLRWEELNKVDDSDSLILVGTGSLLGEGFDFPRLDTLFMATPVSGENVVEQYVGRLNRDYDGKEKMSSSMIMWTVIFQSSIKCIQQG